MGQKVWLSTKDLPLRVECQKLVPPLCGSFSNSQGDQPGGSSPSTASIPQGPPNLPCLQDQSLIFIMLWAFLRAPSSRPTDQWVHGLHLQEAALFQMVGSGRVTTTWWTGRATGLRNGHGSLPTTFLTSPSSVTSMVPTLTRLEVRQELDLRGGTVTFLLHLP